MNEHLEYNEENEEPGTSPFIDERAQLSAQVELYDVPPELGHLESKGFALDLLQGKSIEAIAQTMLDVFDENPTLQNEMRRKLVFDLNVLENGAVNNKRIRITLILKGFYGHGIDDRLLSLLAAKLSE